MRTQLPRQGVYRCARRGCPSRRRGAWTWRRGRSSRCGRRPAPCAGGRGPAGGPWLGRGDGAERFGVVLPRSENPDLGHPELWRCGRRRSRRFALRRRGRGGRWRRRLPLNRLFDAYRDRVAFHAVYIQEAHPSDIWQMRSNIREGVVFRNPRSEGERFQVADSCVRTLGIRFPALIDGMDNTVEQAYTGWPDRLYLIGRDGRVVYKSRPGPFGFEPAGLEAAIRGLL